MPLTRSFLAPTSACLPSSAAPGLSGRHAGMHSMARPRVSICHLFVSAARGPTAIGYRPAPRLVSPGKSGERLDNGWSGGLRTDVNDQVIEISVAAERQVLKGEARRRRATQMLKPVGICGTEREEHQWL